MDIKTILELTAEVVAKKLDIEVPEIRYFYSFKHRELGSVYEDKPNIVFLDLEEIRGFCEFRETDTLFVSIKTLIHEMRHLWQIKNNWDLEYHLPYEDRRCEIDAETYAKNNINKFIHEVYANSVA